MAIPDFQTLMEPVLRLTADGAADMKAVTAKLAAEFSLSAEDVALKQTSGRTTVLANRAHWARWFLKGAGLVAPMKRGAYSVTPAGLALLMEKPQRIDMRFLERYPEYVAWRDRTSGRIARDAHESASSPLIPTTLAEPETTPQERIRSAVSQIDARLADELLDRLMGGSPGFFEEAVVRLLLAMGYGAGSEAEHRLRGAPGDGGIDGVINEDALGLDRVYVQAKRYAADNSVSRPALQQFVGSLTGEGASKGVFVTTSRFTEDAKRFIEKAPQRIVLIDGQRLARLMIAHGVGVQTSETIAIREIDENFFADD